MKIAYLLTQNLESPSGLGRYWPMARELARLGHQMQIFALHPDFGSVQSDQFEREGVKIRYVAPMHVIKQGNSKRYYPSHQLLDITAGATWKLTRAAWRCEADIIHICKPHPMNSLAGLFSRLKQDHGLLFLDCDDYEAGSGNFSAKWQEWIVAGFEQWVPRQVHTVTANTHFIMQKLAEWGVPENRMVYLPNGLDQYRFRQIEHERAAELKNQLGLQGKTVVSYIGSLSLANHAVDLLLEAFSKIRAALPETVLMLVGGGEDFDTLQATAGISGLASAIRWVGRVPPEDVPLYYKLAQVSVDPVRDDAAARGRCPLKLFESWAAGTPFVSGNAGDRQFLLGLPPAGLLAQPGDADSLANCLTQVLNNPVLAEELRQRGLKKAQEYSWENLAIQLEATYKNTLSLYQQKSSE